MDSQTEQVMMMKMRRVGNARNQCSSDESIPTWKLYENPFYNCSEYPASPYCQKHLQYHHRLGDRQLHRLHLPISTRKIAASFWDLTFIRPLLMEAELELSRAQITRLKAELVLERKARKKLEAISNKLGREACRERRGREKLERVCEQLLQEKAQKSTGTKSAMEKETRMLRTADCPREERVRMNPCEARVLLEERMLELDFEVKRRGEVSNEFEKIGSVSVGKAKCGGSSSTSTSTSTSTARYSHHSLLYAINNPKRPPKSQHY